MRRGITKNKKKKSYKRLAMALCLLGCHCVFHHSTTTVLQAFAQRVPHDLRRRSLVQLAESEAWRERGNEIFMGVQNIRKCILICV